MKHAGNDPTGEHIEHVLHALSNTKPADGLERRTLAALQARATGRAARDTPSGLFSSFSAWRQALTGVLAGGVLVTAVALHSRHSEPKTVAQWQSTPQREHAATAMPEQHTPGTPGFAAQPPV